MFHVKHSAASVQSPLSGPSIEKALESVGVPATIAQCAMISLHASMVLEANEHFNLTRISEPADVLGLHILDSATALEEISQAPAGLAADLGSGPGYPGVVLAVLSGRQMLLVESVKKKATFLGGVVGRIDANLDVFPSRAEELAMHRPGEFSVVVARALAPLPSLVELASPLLTLGGRLVAMKGRPTSEELAAGLNVCTTCGMRQLKTVETVLVGEHSRTLVVYERVGTPRIALPRRVGLAQRAPLA